MSNGYKILLIEDEIYLNDLYKLVLEKEGYKVDTAYDGQKGIDLAQENPSVVLLDIMLPLVNGIDVLRNLKENPATKDIPVIVLSNLGQDSVVQQAIKLGALEYVIKLQIEPKQIVEKVNKVLGRA